MLYEVITKFPPDFAEKNPSMHEMIEFNRDTGLYGVAPDDWDGWLAGRLDNIEAGDITPVRNNFV